MHSSKLRFCFLCENFCFENNPLAIRYVTVSAKTRHVRTIKKIFFYSLSIIGSVQGIDHQFQPSVVCSFEIISLDSRKSKIIDLYIDYTENKLQVLTFAVITSVWISLQLCNLA